MSMFGCFVILEPFSGSMVYNFIPSGLLTIPYTKYLTSRAFRFAIFFGISQPTRLPSHGGLRAPIRKSAANECEGLVG
jgi:hypothetical protein